MLANFIQQQPVIIHLEPPPSEHASAVQELTRIIVGSLGLTGLFVLVAVVLGVVIGAVMFWVRSRQ